MIAKKWSVEKTGYKPCTPAYSVLTKAEAAGTQAVEQAYKTLRAKYGGSYKQLTELVMVLNWKVWQTFSTNQSLSMLYHALYRSLDGWCCEHLQGEELDYFYRTVNYEIS